MLTSISCPIYSISISMALERETNESWRAPMAKLIIFKGNCVTALARLPYTNLPTDASPQIYH